MVGRIIAPKDMRSKSTEPINVILYNKDFADVIKLRVLR